MPKSNQTYWDAKIENNMKRDRRVDRQLRRDGWTVVRIWEHSLMRPDRIAARIRRILASKL